MDPKGEESSSSLSSGASPSPPVHQNSMTDEPVSQEQGKETVKENTGEVKSNEATQNGIAKMNSKIEDLSDDEDYKSCEGDLDGEREQEKEGKGPGEKKPHSSKSRSEERESESEDHRRHPRDQKWSEALKAKLFASVDKDSNYFSYMFLDKIFGEARPCKFCGARGTAKLPPGDESLKLFVLEDGIIGKQNILCSQCGKIDTVISDDDESRLPTDDRLSITGTDIRYYCRNVTHYEILHDLMEMLHIAATDDDSQRQEKHHEVADFMLKNVRKVCEEWCRPEYAELRLKKYLRLRDETLLTMYNPTFTPDCTEEYKEMYEMMANSFRQNRDKVLLLLQLMKESLIDSPTRSTFMMWVSIAMMHSESYSQFKTAYDPRSFMRVDSSEYQALQDRYLALEVPLGIKKIPVIFILFEIPRFYHYVEFLNQRIGKKKTRNYLSEEERDMLQSIEEETLKMGLKMKPRTGKMVSPEAHLDFLTRQEEYEREMIYQSCRDKEKAKQQKLHNALKAATSVKGGKRAISGTSDSSSNPSINKKTEPAKASLSSSSNDSMSQTNSSSSSKSASVATTTSNKSTSTTSSSYTDRQSYFGSDISKPVANKKKRRKAKLDKIAESEASLSVEEKARRRAIEDAARKKREEFISHDAFHAILRETLEASEASKNVVVQEEEPEEDKQKQRLRRILKKREEEREREMALKEEKGLRKEEKVTKESEKAAKGEKKPSKWGEKKALKEEERKSVKEEKKSAKVEQKRPLKDDSKPKNEKEKMTVKGDDKKASKEGTTVSKDEGEKASKEEEKRASKEEERKLQEEKEKTAAAKVETKGTETENKEKEKSDGDSGEKKEEGKSSGSNHGSGKAEKQKKSVDDGTQVPKVIKPEVNPDSPLANISLPPRPGADPKRKPINLPSMEPTNTPATKYTTRSTLKKELREQIKASRRHKKSGRDSRTVLCAQVDTEMLRAQGYKISGNSPVTTVVANSDGTIEHILEGLNTPEQVKTFLSKRYSILNQQAGSGYLTMPSKGDPGAIIVDPESELKPYINTAATKALENEPKQPGNPKKRKKVRAAQQDSAISTLMDCYAQQRQQSQPGAWKTGLEPQEEVGSAGGVLDEAMCGALGGGDLTKALSTAFKGAMAQAESQGNDEKSDNDGSGWSGIGSYKIAPDGTGSIFNIADKCEPVPESGCGSRSPSSGSNSSLSDSDKPANPSESSGSGKTSSDKTGSEKSGSSNSTGRGSGSDKTGNEKNGSGSNAGSGAGTGSGSGSNAGDKNGDGDKKGSGNNNKSGSGTGNENSNSKTEEKSKSGSGSSKSGSNDKKESKDTSGKSRDKSGKSRDKSTRSSGSTALSRVSKLDESRWICRLGNESTIIHTDETREVVISRGEQLITLKPIGKAYMRNWSIGKKELFRRHQCKGLDEKIYTVNSDAEAKLVFQDAMKPCDLGPLEGPCPRYVVPSSGGKIRFPDYFEDMSDIEDLADYIHSHAAPRQQMALLDAMSFPYKLEMTKVFMPHRDRDGNEIPGSGMKCAIVSKITMLPKELAHKMVEVLDHGLLLQLIDSDDEEDELLHRKEIEPPAPKEIEPPPKRKEIEPPPRRKEIEAPPKRKEIEAPPPKKKEAEAPPPPPPKKNEPSPKNTISTADLALDDARTDMAVDTLTRLVAHTLATKTRLKDVPISMDNLSESIMDVLKDMSTADLLAHIQNDEELGITVPRESGVKPSRRKTNNRSGKELREKLAAKHSANKLAKEREAALASYNSVTDTTGSGSTTAQSRKKKVKKKPPKKSESQAGFEESQPTVLSERAPDPGLVVDETPISISGQELGVGNTPEPEPEPVRDIDDIDDIDVGVSEDLLKGGGIGGGASGGHASSTVATATSGNDSVPAKTSQSKVVAAREKFRFCENCASEIEDKILVCSSCKKVAYCNRQCQKAHWKAHKKTCSHKVNKEDCTG